MDYTEVPRSLIFKDRTDLNDFGVQTQETINEYLFTQMRKLKLLHCGDAKRIALQCFNNAYYICTLIQLDEYPDLSMDKYEKKLMEVNIPFPEDVYQASMALVCVLLAAYDNKYKQKDNLLIESIHNWTSSNKWTGSLSHKSFEDILRTCSTDIFALPKSVFAPRDIIEVVETFKVELLQAYAEYICERLTLLKDLRQRMHGADTAIARIKDYQRKLCEDSDYNPKKDCFKYAENDYYRDFAWEERVRNDYQQSKEALDYYTEHYPTKDDSDSKDSKEEVAESPQAPETVFLQATIRELESKLNFKEQQCKEANEINIKQASRIKELEEERARQSAENKELREKIENEISDNEDLDDIQRLAIDERIVFFSSALGVSLDPQYISQRKMAVFISKLSGDKPESIRTRITALNSEEKIVHENKDAVYSQKTKEAADNVYKFVASVSKSYSVRTKAMKDIMKNIDIIYGLNKEKKNQ